MNKMVLFLCLLIHSLYSSGKNFSYQKLYDKGIVSGFGERRGNPLRHINRIPSIEKPKWIIPQPSTYKDGELFIGIKSTSDWYFSPISILDQREIVHTTTSSIAYCPLAGLALSVKDHLYISGLLKYDTFLLFKKSDHKIFEPLSQNEIEGNNSILYQPIHLINYRGILDVFPKAKVLDLSGYDLNRKPYGDYSSNAKQGIGHPKPGAHLFSSKLTGYHPKERVLVIGRFGVLEKGYPLSEIKKYFKKNKNSELSDEIEKEKISIYYDKKYDWVRAESEGGESLNLAFVYIFALKQHNPQFSLWNSP